MAEAEGQAEYYQVPSRLYQPNDIIERDLFIYYQGRYLLFRPRNLLWKLEDTKRLEEFDVKHLYIHCGSRDDHFTFLEANLQRIIDESKIDNAQKSAVIYEASTAVISAIFDRPNSPETVKRSVSLVRNSVDFLKDQENFAQLMRLASTDFHEYTHAIQVAAYSIALARALGLKSFNELSAIGIGSILHDIGKTKIPQKLLNKPSELSEEEYQQVQKHPEFGYEILRRQRSIPEISELVVLQHHERPQGNGYPYGLGSEVVLSAKIVSIADCFDSLTSDRPFRKKLKPLEAIKMMREDLKDEYDQNLLTEFIKVVAVGK